VRHIKTDKEFSIETTETRYHIDGEPIKICGKVNIRIRKEALKVLKTCHNKFI
jgi:diacylglycerol kinase family enzyme